MANYRREIGDLVMGNHDCRRSDVLAAITRSASFGKLHDEWRSVANHLDLTDYKIQQLADESILKVRIRTLPQLVDELLAIWKSEKGDQAKIVHLFRALENCGLTDMAEALSKKFESKEQPKSSQKFIWQGNVVTVDELLPKDLSESLLEVTDIRKELSSSAQATPIIRAQCTPPATPKYYVPRTLSYYPSSEIDSAIFLSELAKNDVFLFKDISKSKLAKLAQYKFAIELSGDQLHDDVSVKLILLECDEDFDRICKNARKNLHMIHRKEERYLWVKSNNNLDLIRKFLKEPLQNISEDDLAERIASLPAPCSFSIADSPGMGKTLVLANLATKIQLNSPTNTIHLFIVLQEFVEQIQRIHSTSSTLKTIAVYSSSNGMTKALLYQMMKNSKYQVHLYLDGYDEVLENNFEMVEKFLAYVQQLQNFKVVVTTRSHMRSRLEAIFNQFSYEIHPFPEPNQIDFLTRYWTYQHRAEFSKVLEEFAGQCVQALQTTLCDEEREVAGIPLQCMMLGYVYAEDAKRASRLKQLRPNLVKPITLFQMYQRLIGLKFRRLPEDGSNQNYLNAHVYQAIRLLFPHRIDMFKSILVGYDDIDETRMYSIGLVEQSPTATPRFLHRTFAEYLLAEFIVGNLGKHRRCVEFLFRKIMGKKGTSKWPHLFVPGTSFGGSYCYNIYKLTLPVVGYFINMHLKESFIDQLLLSDCLALTKLKLRDVCIAVRACCCNDFESTFNYATQLLLRGDFSIGNKMRDKFFQDLPHVTVRHCKDVRILEKLLKFTNQYFGVDLSYHIKYEARPFTSYYTPLHEAVNQGKYNIVTWLVQQYGDQVGKLKYLVNECVFQSVNDSDSVVKDKMLIIDMLASINRSWIEVRNNYDHNPLLRDFFHLSLRKHLVHNGADINAYLWAYGTILHRIIMPKNEYMELVRWALSNGFQLINHTADIGTTPLMHAIKNYGTLEDDILDLFLKAGASLNAEDCAGNSVLLDCKLACCLYGRCVTKTELGAAHLVCYAMNSDATPW